MVSRRWCDPLTQQLGAGGQLGSKPETTTSQLNPNSTAKSRFEIFSKSIRDLAGFRSVVTTTGSSLHRIHMLPHHIRDHRSAPVSPWFDPHSDLARVVGVDPCRIPFDPRWTSDHHRIHRSAAPVSSWFDPIEILPELWVSIPPESHSIHAGQVTRSI